MDKIISIDQHITQTRPGPIVCMDARVASVGQCKMASQTG
jgi:hypothetical protein